MNLVHTVQRLALGTALATAAGTAFAADIAPVVPPAPPVVAVPPPAVVFDWAGAYVGAAMDYFVCQGPCWINLDLHAGTNLVFGRVLAGFEVGAGYWNNFSDAGWLVDFTARAGVVLGRVLPYAKAGFTVYGPLPVVNYVVLGGGVELGIGRSLSVFAEFTTERDIGGGPWTPGVGVGVNWHLGN